MRFAIGILAAFLASSVLAQSATELVEGESAAAQILQDLEGFSNEIQQVNTIGAVSPRKFATIRFLDRLNGDVVELQLARGDKLERQFITVTLKNCFAV